MEPVETRKELPRVPARPDLIDVMRDLGSGSIAVADAYESLRAAMCEYLPSHASLRQGELVGIMLSAALFLAAPAPAASVGGIRRKNRSDRQESFQGLMARSWDEASAEIESPLAADRAVWAFVGDVMLHCLEPSIDRAFHLLDAEKLSVLFPEQRSIK